MGPSPTIIAAVQAQLGPLRDGPVPLDGGITNHNFRATFGEHDVVLRIAGHQTELLGIDRAAERIATEGAAALGIAPPVLLELPEHGCVATAFVAGTPIPETQLREPPTLTAVAQALRAFHDRGPALPTRFDVPQLARDYLALVAARGGTVPTAAREASALADRIAAALTGPEHVRVPCHDDLLAANLLSDGARVWIVDWEYAGMGDRYFDLGNLSVNNGFGEADDERLLEAYWEAPCTAPRFAALRLMRAMSDVREALWGTVQQTISTLDFDFAGYADRHLHRLAATVADPRFERWLRDGATP
jgi:thiamine kinase-like enzyme